MERLVKPELASEDWELEASLRPRTLEEYIGQDRVLITCAFLSGLQMNGESL